MADGAKRFDLPVSAGIYGFTRRLEADRIALDWIEQHLDVAGGTPYGFCIETNHFNSLPPHLIKHEAAAMGHSLSQATIGHEDTAGVARDPYVLRSRPWAGPDRRPRLVSAEGAPDASALNAADIHLLGLLAEGLPLEAVGRRLDLSDRTIRRRARSVCDRIGVRAPIQAVAWAARRGLI